VGLTGGLSGERVSGVGRLCLTARHARHVRAGAALGTDHSGLPGFQ
jgi:hypothetical protein